MIITALTMLAALTLLALVAGFVLARDVARDLATKEISAWLPDLSRKRIRKAAQALPPESQDLLEAWEAELQEFADRPVTMFIVALRISRDKKLIAYETRQATLEPSSSSGARSWNVTSPLQTAAGALAGLLKRLAERAQDFRTRKHFRLPKRIETLTRRFDGNDLQTFRWLTLTLTVALVSVQIGVMDSLSSTNLISFIATHLREFIAGVIIVALVCRIIISLRRRP